VYKRMGVCAGVCVCVCACAYVYMCACVPVHAESVHGKFHDVIIDF